MKRRANIWPFGKGQPLGAKTTHHRRATKPVSAKALAKQAKDGDSERLERKLSDAQLEAKLRKHYARGGNLREFLQANPAYSPEKLTPQQRAEFQAAYPRAIEMMRRIGREIESDPVVRKRAARRNLPKRFQVGGKIVRPGTQAYKRALARSERAKRNPSDEAAAVYEEFHGRPSSEVVTVKEKIHYHEHLAALGELRSLVVVARDGAKVTLSRFRKAILCTNEAKNQMFVRGGDQSVDLGAFGIRKPHEVETLGRVVELAYFTRKDHLGDEGGTALYFHVAGETNENGKRKMAGWGPDLIYRTLDESLEFSGGSYTIRAEGVDK